MAEPKTQAPGYWTVAPKPGEQPQKFKLGSTDIRPQYRDDIDKNSREPKKPILEQSQRIRVVGNANDPAKEQFLQRRKELEEEKRQMAEKERELNEALQMIEAQRIDEAKEKGENNIRNSLRPRTGTPDSYAEEMKEESEYDPKNELGFSDEYDPGTDTGMTQRHRRTKGETQGNMAQPHQT